MMRCPPGRRARRYSSVAAPAPVARIYADPRLDRISGDVRHNRQKLSLGQDRFVVVPILKDVAFSRSVLPVEAAPIVPVEPSHAVAEVRLLRLDQQVEVSAHQAKTQAMPAVTRYCGGEHRDIADAILVAAKDELVVHAAHARVVDE